MSNAPTNLPISNPSSGSQGGNSSSANQATSLRDELVKKPAESTPLAPSSFKKPPHKKGKGGRMTGVLLVILITLLILGGIGYFAYQLFFNEKIGNNGAESAADNANGGENRGNGQGDDETGTLDLGPWTTLPPCLNPDDEGVWLRDPDEDGLTNAEERLFGTDPCNPDTSGDGMLDGESVRSGLNPLGPGRLDFERYGLPDPNVRTDNDSL